MSVASTAAGAAKKLTGPELWKKMGNPRYVVAPMVDQSELAFRMLCRKVRAPPQMIPHVHLRAHSRPGRGTRHWMLLGHIKTGGSPPSPPPQYGADLAYTPMLHARLFVEDKRYREEMFTTCNQPAGRPPSAPAAFCCPRPPPPLPSGIGTPQLD